MSAKVLHQQYIDGELSLKEYSDRLQKLQTEKLGEALTFIKEASQSVSDVYEVNIKSIYQFVAYTQEQLEDATKCINAVLNGEDDE